MRGGTVPVLALLCLAVVAAPSAAATADSAAVTRGEYLFRASGGCSCHTDAAHEGAWLAGGRAMVTPFGTLYSTNITPDAETGIGAWSDADFVAAMRQGVGPGGRHFFPAFPYTSFTRMTDADLLDLKAYLFALPPVENRTPPPDMPPPFRWRFTLPVWKALYLDAGPMAPEPDSSAAWNRGAYLVRAVAHCGECHTPRDLLGGLRSGAALSGTAEGPEGELAPNITPDDETGIGRWSEADLTWYLQTGLEPGGDSAQGVMWEVIEQGYQHLTSQDLQAIARYLRSVPAVRHEVRRGD